MLLEAMAPIAEESCIGPCSEGIPLSDMLLIVVQPASIAFNNCKVLKYKEQPTLQVPNHDDRDGVTSKGASI